MLMEVVSAVKMEKRGGKCIFRTLPDLEEVFFCRRTPEEIT